MNRKLTPKQQEVFTLMGDGFGRIEIAQQMGLSPKTVDAHTQSLKLILNMKSTRQLVIHAVKANKAKP